MEKYKAKNGSTFAFDPELQAPILMIEEGAEGEASTVSKVDASDLLEFAEFLFNKARYESVARLRISAGDVLLIRTLPGLSEAQLVKVEKGVRNSILAPLGLEDKVTVVSLDGALDLEVVERG